MVERNRRWALVLGGGAARGLAHLGVLQVLDGEALRPDLVVGVSAGAVAGGLFCGGVSPGRMIELAHQIGWRKLARWAPARLGMVDISPLGRLIAELTGEASIEDLELPFVAVAADIRAGALVTFDHGPLSDAVLASCSVPGVVIPVERDGQLLTDGGVLNDLPVHVARRMGVDAVVAVNLLPPTKVPAKRPANLMEMWSLSFFTLTRQARVGEGREADVLILPDIADASFLDFRQTDTLIRKGREAADASLPVIVELLGRSDGSHQSGAAGV